MSKIICVQLSFLERLLDLAPSSARSMNKLKATTLLLCLSTLQSFYMVLLKRKNLSWTSKQKVGWLEMPFKIDPTFSSYKILLFTLLTIFKVVVWSYQKEQNNVLAIGGLIKISYEGCCSFSSSSFHQNESVHPDSLKWVPINSTLANVLWSSNSLSVFAVHAECSMCMHTSVQFSAMQSSDT